MTQSPPGDERERRLRDLLLADFGFDLGSSLDHSLNFKVTVNSHSQFKPALMRLLDLSQAFLWVHALG